MFPGFFSQRFPDFSLTKFFKVRERCGSLNPRLGVVKGQFPRVTFGYKDSINQSIVPKNRQTTTNFFPHGITLSSSFFDKHKIQNYKTSRIFLNLNYWTSRLFTQLTLMQNTPSLNHTLLRFSSQHRG